MASARLAAQHDRSTPCSDPGRSEHRSSRQKKKRPFGLLGTDPRGNGHLELGFPRPRRFLGRTDGEPRKEVFRLSSRARKGKDTVLGMARPTPPSVSSRWREETPSCGQSSRQGRRSRTDRMAPRSRSVARMRIPFLTHACVGAFIALSEASTHPSIHPSIHHPCHSFSSSWDPSVERFRFRPIPPTSKRTYAACRKHRVHTTVPQQLDGRSAVSIRRLLPNVEKKLLGARMEHIVPHVGEKREQTPRSDVRPNSIVITARIGSARLHDRTGSFDRIVRARWMEGKGERHVHERITFGEEEEDIDPLVDQQGCGRVYAQLETCLGEHDRDWRACQDQVKALRDCYQKATGKETNRKDA